MTIQTNQIVKNLTPSKPVTINTKLRDFSVRAVITFFKSKISIIRGLPNPEFKIEDSSLVENMPSLTVATKQVCFKNSSEQIA
jgi:hypothetical protein